MAKKKIVLIGGGRMILTDNEVYAKRAKYLITQIKDDGIRYILTKEAKIIDLTNMRTALGVAQLNHLQKSYEDYQICQIGKATGLWEKTLNVQCSVNLNKRIELILKVL